MFVRTERLMLRPGWVEDAPSLAAAIGDEAILTKLALAPSPYQVADAREFLSLPRTEDHADFLIFARTRGEPRLVGGVGLKADGPERELGYWIARPFWGMGFATEAARAVVSLARHSLRLPRLVSGHFVDNPASGQVLRKLGFHATGEIVPRECRARGRMVPCKLFSLDFAEEEEIEPMPQMMAA
jgi:RimJ/RimL family protein N-acetyltransferase